MIIATKNFRPPGIGDTCREFGSKPYMHFCSTDSTVLSYKL